MYSFPNKQTSFNPFGSLYMYCLDSFRRHLLKWEIVWYINQLNNVAGQAPYMHTFLGGGGGVLFHSSVLVLI